MEIAVMTGLLAKWDMDVDACPTQTPHPPTGRAGRGGVSPPHPKKGVVINILFCCSTQYYFCSLFSFFTQINNCRFLCSPFGGWGAILFHKSTPTRITFSAFNFTFIIKMANRCRQTIGRIQIFG